MILISIYSMILPCVPLAGALLAVATAGAASPSAVERARVLMGTTCRLEAHGVAAHDVDAALDAVARVESELSTWRDDTPLSRLNAAAGGPPVELSPSLLRFLLDARGWADATGGAFDPVVGALVDAWDLRGRGRVPSEAALGSALAASGSSLLEIDAARGTARLARAGAWIDSGGIAKGLALDAAARALRESGATGALLDFGGQVLVTGRPAESETWTVAVADPRDRERPALLLGLRDGESLATSAQSERGLVVDGRRVGHVLDPRTGLPAETAASATSLARTAQDADALSTALLVLGPDDGLAWLEEHPAFDGAWLVPQDDGGLLLVASAGFLARVVARAEGVAVAGAALSPGATRGSPGTPGDAGPKLLATPLPRRPSPPSVEAP